MFAAPLLVMLKILAAACGPPRLVGEIRVLERRAVKTKRPGTLLAAAILFAVSMVFLVIYFVRPNGLGMLVLWRWSFVIATVLLVAAVITGPAARTAARPANPTVDTARTNGFAIASLVLSLVGLSVLAIIFGHVSKSQMKRTGEAGSGLATAGLILGYVELIATACAVFYVLASAP